MQSLVRNIDFIREEKVNGDKRIESVNLFHLFNNEITAQAYTLVTKSTSIPFMIVILQASIAIKVFTIQAKETKSLLRTRQLLRQTCDVCRTQSTIDTSTVADTWSQRRIRTFFSLKRSLHSLKHFGMSTYFGLLASFFIEKVFMLQVFEGLW